MMTVVLLEIHFWRRSGILIFDNMYYLNLRLQYIMY
jgi:hypothetical protein